MSVFMLFGLCLLISGMAIRLGISLAPSVGVMDYPGGHKQHDTSTPFIGGLGVMTALIGAVYLMEIFFPGTSSTLNPSVLIMNAGTMFLVGLADDKWQLGFKTRFFFQVLVALSMVYLGGVMLSDLGHLLPGGRLELGLLVVPFTVFATVGVINALNMIDGIDGLSGSLSLGSLVLISLIALIAGHQANFMLAISLAGGVAGFLFFNLRHPINKRARVFLGDNGSMLLGFLFALMFIDLSQGVNRAMDPVTALWLFSLPLMDTVAVMLRRIWMKKSPFRADRNHLHHIFLRSGFRVSDTVLVLALIHFLFGLAGVAGLWLNVPESLMFAAFLLTFALYFHIIARPWRIVPLLRGLHARLGLPSAQARGIYIGHVSPNDTRALIEILAAELGDRYEYHLSLHEVDAQVRDGRTLYAILEMSIDYNDASLAEINRLIGRIKLRLAGWFGVQVRQFVQRNAENDRRAKHGLDNEKDSEIDSRNSDRRVTGEKMPVQTLKNEIARKIHRDGILPALRRPS
jgi:UDP-GlcNAc:undecaprenyl-phosphate GlcNAc-1-phosphate transferase